MPALLKKHATAKDPWAREYTKSHTSGSGAFKVVSWKPGVETVYERYDGWVGGKLPALKRVIWRTIPSQGNRRALMERGDADMSFDLPSKDASEMKKEGKVVIISNPIGNGMYSLELNVAHPPFNNEKVRQAIAYAIPYEKIMSAAVYGLANPLFGGPSNTVTDIAWPRQDRLQDRHGQSQGADEGVGLGPDHHHHLLRPRPGRDLASRSPC